MYVFLQELEQDLCLWLSRQLLMLTESQVYAKRCMVKEVSAAAGPGGMAVMDSLFENDRYVQI